MVIVQRPIQGGMWANPPPGPVKSIEFRGFLDPNGCWAPPGTNSWIHPILHFYTTNSTNFLNPYSLILIIFYPIQYSVYRNSHHQHSFICIHLNQHSYMHIVCIFNNYVFNMCYTLYNCHFTCYKTVKVKLLFIKKSRIYWHWFKWKHQFTQKW